MRLALKLVLLPILVFASCATAGPDGSEGMAADAAGEQIDDEVADAALLDDAASDGAAIDAAMIDASIDAAMIDASIDAATIDAAIPDAASPVCGNGVPEGQEVCDDNNLTAGDGCAADCMSTGPILFDDFEVGSTVAWTLIDVDGRTPNADVSFMTSAWVVASDGITPTPANRVAVSTSYYDPTGSADDWLISPALALDGHSVLSWRAYAPDADYRDGYEVRISTTTPDVAGFTANAELFAVSQEQITWQSHSVDLAAAGYANQPVYIAFRNNTNDKFLLLLDTVVVE